MTQSLCIYLALSLGLVTVEEPPAGVAAAVAKLQVESRELRNAMMAEFGKRYAPVEEADKRAALEHWYLAAEKERRRADQDAVRALMPALRQAKADPEAVAGLIFAALGGDTATRAEAGSMLRDHHRTHPKVLTLAAGPWGYEAEGWVAPLLRAMLADEAVPADRRPKIRFALARHLQGRAQLPTEVVAWAERTEFKHTPEEVAELVKLDSRRLEAEALVLYDALVADKVSGEFVPGWPLVDAARSGAYEIRHLAVGKTAPDIAAGDLDGRPLRLSDFRGKVIVLTFWNSRCGACVDFVAHEKKLVERFAGKPFTPVGVCVDDDRAVGRAAAGKQGQTWPSFWGGPKGTTGELSQTWNVESWPTIYVLDHAGVIRSKTHRGPELDTLLDELVKRAEAVAAK